jgi:hypothetical protein
VGVSHTQKGEDNQGQEAEVEVESHDCRDGDAGVAVCVCGSQNGLVQLITMNESVIL